MKIGKIIGVACKAEGGLVAASGTPEPESRIAHEAQAEDDLGNSPDAMAAGQQSLLGGGTHKEPYPDKAHDDPKKCEFHNVTRRFYAVQLTNTKAPSLPPGR
ncbi:MAG: hypothetical protein ABR530_08810 [Pyrinomonadaceae bacterium]